MQWFHACQSQEQVPARFHKYTGLWWIMQIWWVFPVNFNWNMDDAVTWCDMQLALADAARLHNRPGGMDLDKTFVWCSSDARLLMEVLTSTRRSKLRKDQKNIEWISQHDMVAYCCPFLWFATYYLHESIFHVGAHVEGTIIKCSDQATFMVWLLPFIACKDMEAARHGRSCF